ncbi:MAG: universal stress protein [Ectothiorhodospiraceae bacterium]|nr:universal stress protein [Ectothiorhodospiraceae bacterium]
MSKTILVPIDGSEHSRKALELACELGTKLGASLHLLHVAQSLHEGKTLVLGAAAVTVHAPLSELEKAGEQVIQAATRFAREHGVDAVETEITTGDPAKRIVEAARAEKADMVVMGSRGLSDLSGLMLGSVSHKVSHLAPCTCVTVR